MYTNRTVAFSIPLDKSYLRLVIKILSSGFVISVIFTKGFECPASGAVLIHYLFFVHLY